MFTYHRDTFHTIKYKNVYIRICQDSQLHKQVVEFTINDKRYTYSSLEYAKRIIRRKGIKYEY